MFKIDGLHTNVFGAYPIMQYIGTYTEEYELKNKIVTGMLKEIVVDCDETLGIYITRNIDNPSKVSIIYYNEHDEQLSKWTPIFEDIFDPLITGDELMSREIHVKIMEEMARNIKAKVGFELSDIVYGTDFKYYSERIDWMVKRNFANDDIDSEKPIMELYSCLNEIMKSDEINYRKGKGASMASDAFKDYGLMPYDEWVIKYQVPDRWPDYIVRKKEFLANIQPF